MSAASWQATRLLSIFLSQHFPRARFPARQKFAMQIISELEPQKRGLYAGAIGYFGYNGNLDTCIVTRTIVMKGKKVFINAGAGIVADSDPDLEYQETLNKAGAMLKAVDL